MENRLKQLRVAAGMTQKQRADKLGVAQNTVSGWEKGKTAIDRESIMEITELFDVTIDYLFGKSEKSVSSAVKIPVLGYVRAGYPQYAAENILDYEEIPQAMAQNGEYFALQIKGDSMSPRILDGDVVIVRKQPVVENGQIAVVLVNGDEATVKKVMCSQDGITLIPLKPVYDPMFYSKKDVMRNPVTILGRVVENRSKF